jgi:hypothetical protein
MNRKKENIVLVRICIGCILPYNNNLIGQGTYPYYNEKGKVIEHYYDYEINEKDLKEFLFINTPLLKKYNLIDADFQIKNKEKTPPTTPTTTRGWSKKVYKT